MHIAWKKLSEKVEKVGYRTVLHKKFELPDGTNIDFTTIGDRSENAAVIALTQENRVVIARQYRPGPEKILDELPGGSVDDGETAEQAAKRELLEETGYTTDVELVFVGSGYRDAYKNEVDNYFMAFDCYQSGEQQLEATEFIEIREIPIEELLVNARLGKMSDGIGVLMAYDRLMEAQNYGTKK